jgi:hypothetical protein
MAEETKAQARVSRRRLRESKARAPDTGRWAATGGSFSVSQLAARAGASSTVTIQARVDSGFLRELVEKDAPALGIGTRQSDLVREGLRLLHEHAREAEAVAELDDFYGGEPAPLPDGVVPADAG